MLPGIRSIVGSNISAEGEGSTWQALSALMPKDGRTAIYPKKAQPRHGLLQPHEETESKNTNSLHRSRDSRLQK